MPTMRQNTAKGKFSNYGKSVFVTKTKNTEYFARATRKQPTMRGAFPKPIVASNVSSRKPQQTLNVASKTSVRNTTPRKPEFEGTAVKKAQPKVQKPDFTIVPGNLRTKGIFQTTALSPMLLTCAKIAIVAVIVIAVAAFIRVGFTAATVSTGISSQNLSAQIQDELIQKNKLEVEDSTLGNSSKIRNEAAQYQLVTPATVESIDLGEDIVAYDKSGNVSLVQSLNRAAHNGR